MQIVAILSTIEGQGGKAPAKWRRSDPPLIGRSLAGAADAAGAGPVALLMAEGTAHRPDWPQGAIVEARRQAARYLFLELPPAEGEPPPVALTAADLLIIATGAQERELALAGTLAGALARRGRPFVFLLVAGSDEDLLLMAATELAQHGTVAPVMLPPPEEEQPFAELWAYLGERLERLPQIGERLAGRAPDGRERRAHPRYVYRQVGTLRRGEEVARCEILDISLGGVAAVSELVPRPGEELELHMPTIGRFAVELARRSGNRLGLRFRLDAFARQRLLQHLWLLAEVTEPLADPAEADRPPVAARTPVLSAEAVHWKRELEEGFRAIGAAIAEAHRLRAELAEALAGLARGPLAMPSLAVPSIAAPPPDAADPLLRQRIHRLFGT